MSFLQLFFLLMMGNVVLLSSLPKEKLIQKQNTAIVKRHASTQAYGYTNVYIKYAKKDKKVRKRFRKKKVNKFIPSGGPYRTDSWRNVRIPNPLMLNERFRNPKFISRRPKRKKVNSSAINANILNTNYKQAFLSKRKYKVKTKIANNLPHGVKDRMKKYHTGQKKIKKYRIAKRRKLTMQSKHKQP